jgi:thioesterase domain-containing protein/acyl carrier protein
MREDGSTGAPGEIGEIVVRGPGVMPGYLDDESPFVGEWFHTGDLGQIDDEGFLALSGRVKEMINRGGEKVAPQEIDNALLAHPAVKEAAAFAVPHLRLGQNVAAAVVLKESTAADSQELRRFLRTKIAPVKVPQRIFVVSELPRSSAGKVKRDALTNAFAHAADSGPGRKPLSAFEVMMADIWKRLLERDDIGVDDDFFEKGGDSLLAVRMLLEAETVFDVKLPDDVLFEASTIRQILRCVEEGRSTELKPVIQLQDGSETPVFFFHGDFAGGGIYARKIAPVLGKDRPFYVVATHGTRGDQVPHTIEEMAADRLESIRQLRPHGPYVIAGYCHGAHVALETARRLMEAQEPVDAVLMIEPLSLNAWSGVRLAARVVGLATVALSRSPEAQKRIHRLAMHAFWKFLLKLDAHVARGQYFLSMPAEARTAKIAEKLKRAVATLSGRAQPKDSRLQQSPSREPDPNLAEIWDSELWRTVGYVSPTYIPRLPPTRVICYVGKATPGYKFSTRPWSRLGAVDIVEIAGSHATCITTHVADLAESMRRDLASVAPADRLRPYRRIAEPGNNAVTDLQ